MDRNWQTKCHRQRAFIILLLVMACLHGFGQNKKAAVQFFEKGEQALEANSYKTALAHFNECLRLDPYFMEAYQSRAMAKEHLGDTKGALNDFNIYLESKPDNAEALFTRAVLRYQYGQWEVAREDFLKLLKLPAGETSTVFYQTDKSTGAANKIMTAQGEMRSTFFNYLGLIDSKMKKFLRAISYMDSAIKLNPKNPDYYLNRGLAKQMSGDTIQAVADYQLTLEADPENTLARHNLASLSSKKVDPKESLKLLDEAIEKNPKEPYSYSQRGFIKLNMNDLQGALQDYTQALKLDAQDADYWFNRAIVKEKMKDNAGALEDYTQAIKVREDYEKVWLNRGNLLHNMGKVKEAVDDYTVAIRYHPEYGSAFYNRALAHQKLANPKDACNDLLQAQKFGMVIEKKVMEKICGAKK